MGMINIKKSISSSQDMHGKGLIHLGVWRLKQPALLWLPSKYLLWVGIINQVCSVTYTDYQRKKLNELFEISYLKSTHKKLAPHNCVLNVSPSPCQHFTQLPCHSYTTSFNHSSIIPSFCHFSITPSLLFLYHIITLSFLHYNHSALPQYYLPSCYYTISN